MQIQLGKEPRALESEVDLWIEFSPQVEAFSQGSEFNPDYFRVNGLDIGRTVLYNLAVVDYLQYVIHHPTFEAYESSARHSAEERRAEEEAGLWTPPIHTPFTRDPEKKMIYMDSVHHDMAMGIVVLHNSGLAKVLKESAVHYLKKHS